MKIGYLIHDIDSRSGWGRYSSDLIFGVKASGVSVVILKEASDGLEGIPILRGGKGIFLSSIRSLKYLKDCDIIHALDGYPYGVIATLSNLVLKKKLVITCVGTYAVAPLYNLKTARLLKMSYKNANRIISISDYTKQKVLDRVELDRIDVINPGIDFKKFYIKHSDFYEQFVLGVGALKYRKGYHVSIPAFALAKSKLQDLDVKYKNLKYKIVGNQEERSYFNQLKELAKIRGVGDSVEFLTDVSDEELRKLYQEARIFVLTSINHDHHFEGFGLVFLEAAAAGTPVIGTFGNGIEDAIKDGYNGILVPQNDIEKTSESIVEIMGNSNKWFEMSQNSHKWAEDHRLENAIEKYLAIYRQVLN